MKNLRFNFGHPVKCRARISQVFPDKLNCHAITVETTKDNVLEIPVDQCHKGKWKVDLEWEHDDRNFFLNDEFEVLE